MSGQQRKDGPDRRHLWAKRSAVQYLGTYSSSVENLRRTVARRARRRYEGMEEGEAAELAAAAIEFCIEHGLVDDVAYAEIAAASGARKGHSSRRISAKLEEKGVAREAADGALATADDLASAIIFARRRRIGPWRRGEMDATQRRKEAAAFGRQGFPGDVAFKVMAMGQDEAEGYEAAARHP